MADNERAPGAMPPESLWAGLTGTLRDGLELVRVRLALLGVEAQDHAQAVVMSLCLGLAATLLLCLGLGFLAVLLTVLWWEGQRTLALALFSAVFLTLGAVAAWAAWRGLSRQSPWFASSTRELARDVEKLTP
jgi:uncharacterized membrane protein YqjE